MFPIDEHPYPILGIHVPAGQPPPLRRNFNDWSTNHEQSISVSLFIRALQRWYRMGYQDQLSYFRIAAIHGYPKNLAWNGVENPGKFCAHNNILFPTWHRPYMLLFEQRIYELMREVITKELSFPVPAENQQWLDMALEWRLPYWDWGLPSAAGHIPDLFTLESIAIRQPLDAAGATPTTLAVKNPLASYQLRTGSPEKETAMGTLPYPYTVDDVNFEDGTRLPWSECAGTSRWGITDREDKSKWMLGINNWEGCNKAIDGHHYEDDSKDGKKAPINKQTISDLCYRILTKKYAPEWETFATTWKDSVTLPMKKWTKYLSLEYIHNSLHGFIGGDAWSNGIGHMQNVPSAAFDPIFFMHHCNIDRLIAIYQTLYPNNWFPHLLPPPSKALLEPFYHESNGNIRIFTSDDVRDWTKFGYQYDVLQRQPRESDKHLRVRIDTWVKLNYGGAAKLLLDDTKELFKDIKTKDDTYPDYIIDVIYDRYALGGAPYTILFYTGEVPPSEIPTRTTALAQHFNFVGSVYNFSSPTTDEDGQGGCRNCEEQAAAGTLSTAQIPLTSTLYYRAADENIAGLDRTLAPGPVEDYLEKELHWMVVSASGEVVSLERLPETKVFVLKGSAQHFVEEEKPSQYGPYSEMSRVTQDKLGGAVAHDYGG